MNIDNSAPNDLYMYEGGGSREITPEYQFLSKMFPTGGTSRVLGEDDVGLHLGTNNLSQVPSSPAYCETDFGPNYRGSVGVKSEWDFVHDPCLTVIQTEAAAVPSKSSSRNLESEALSSGEIIFINGFNALNRPDSITFFRLFRLRGD